MRRVEEGAGGFGVGDPAPGQGLRDEGVPTDKVK